MIIAIDGPAGTGKSTVAKGVAKALGFLYFDTGAMYRSFSWKVQQAGIDPSDQSALEHLASSFKFFIKTDPLSGEKSYFVDDVDVSHKIRMREISQLASQIATNPSVRAHLVQIQRTFGSSSHAVFEGRDMGTVVFPSAEVKIFLTARAEVRANRRYRDLVEKFPDLADSLDKDQLLKEIELRDQKDSTRAISPLKQAGDAILIDTSELTIQEVIDQIVAIVRKIPNKPHLTYRCIRWCARMFFKIFYDLRVYGLSHLRPASGILAANHASYFDPPIISASCEEEVHFLAREGLFRIPLFGLLIRILNSHPVARNASDAQTFRELIRLIQQGKKVILFPEGGRTLDGGLQPMELGLSFLTYKAKCAIFPVYLEGTFQAWNRSMRFPRLFKKIRCVFGSPIPWQEFADLEKRQAMEAIRARTEASLRNLRSWLEAGAEGEPP